MTTSYLPLYLFVFGFTLLSCKEKGSSDPLKKSVTDNSFAGSITNTLSNTGDTDKNAGTFISSGIPFTIQSVSSRRVLIGGKEYTNKDNYHFEILGYFNNPKSLYNIQVNLNQSLSSGSEAYLLGNPVSLTLNPNGENWSWNNAVYFYYNLSSDSNAPETDPQRLTKMIKQVVVQVDKLPLNPQDKASLTVKITYEDTRQLVLSAASFVEDAPIK